MKENTILILFDVKNFQKVLKKKTITKFLQKEEILNKQINNIIIILELVLNSNSCQFNGRIY